MKGISLPINSIVIIAIAMLVLVVLGLFFTGFFTGVDRIKLDNQLQIACSNLRGTAYSCSSSGLDGIVFNTEIVSGEGAQPYTLRSLCELRGLGDEGACMRFCGCAAPGLFG